MNALSEDDLVGDHRELTYDAFVERLNSRFLANCANGGKPLFLTDAKDLWGLYLGSFPDPIIRQHHNCRACRKFIERFGALAVIDDDGRIIPAIWHEDDAPDIYRPAMAALARAVRRAKVAGVFLSSDSVWGTPETGDWLHLALRPNPVMAFKRATRTAEQTMAEKRQDFITVMRALDEFSLPHVETALALLRADALYRSEKVLGHAEWLHGLHVARAAACGSGKANVVWRAVASAPAGFCHPRSSMIGTLLEDIAAGKGFDSVSRAFAEKMHPLVYLRPQAAPKLGAIAEAEKIVNQLGAAGSLARRFARADEIRALWRPAPPHAEPSGGIFGHYGKGVIFVIDGARESRIAGAALFPEILKAEFHGVRSVIEAYSRAATIEGMSDPHAVGVMLDARRESQWDDLVRVWSSGLSLDYRIDRWD